MQMSQVLKRQFLNRPLLRVLNIAIYYELAAFVHSEVHFLVQ